MRFETPKDIEVEDKIFGPLSWRQFLYVFGGVGMAVALFFVAPIWMFLFFGLPLGLLGLALAFYPVNERPFLSFLEAFLTFFFNNRLYLWKQRDDVVYRSPLRREENRVVDTVATSDDVSQTNRLELELIQK